MKPGATAQLAGIAALKQHAAMAALGKQLAARQALLRELSVLKASASSTPGADGARALAHWQRWRHRHMKELEARLALLDPPLRAARAEAQVALARHKALDLLQQQEQRKARRAAEQKQSAQTS